MRGAAAKPGDTRVSANGYHYTRLETKWELTHRIIATRVLGRPIAGDEYVTFRDGNRANITESNVVVRKRYTRSDDARKRRRKAQLEARIEELQAELDSIG